MSSSTVETITSGNKRQRKRLSGAQVLKRRRLAMELKAVKEREENGRTGNVTTGSLGTEGSTLPTSMETDGAGNSDTVSRENRNVENSNSKDEHVGTTSNQTISHNTSKQKWKRKNKKKKVQITENPSGEETPAKELSSSNTEKTKPIAARSNSDRKAEVSSRDGTQATEKKSGIPNTGEKIPSFNWKSSNRDAGLDNRDGFLKPKHGHSHSNEGVPKLDAFSKLNSVTDANYVPASVRIDRLRSNARPKVTKALTPMTRTNKNKKPETERIEESLRLAIVDVDDQSGGLSESVQQAMDGKILAALDAHLDNMQATEKPPILIWSGSVGKAYRVDCLDKSAAEWLTATVPKPNFFTGQKLCVVEAKSLRQKKAKLLKVTV